MQKFRDRFKIDHHLEPVDVVIPLLVAPDNFDEFLKSYYEDVPINRLLIGNAGASTNLLEILKKFPRVVILDHTQTKSLGYSLQLLFNSVKTEWFVYFHSDVSIPLGWYDEMIKYKKQYDWYECKRIDPTSNLNDEFANQLKSTRSYSGSQMGKSKIFQNIQKIDDDYLWRSEDIFFQQEIQKLGFRYGKVLTTYHNHHVEQKKSFDKKLILLSSLKETIKYLSPDIDFNQSTLNDNIYHLIKLNEWNEKYWITWVSKTNANWVPKLKIISKNQKKKIILELKRNLKNYNKYSFSKKLSIILSIFKLIMK